jgi:hypothetical protein
MAVVEKRLAKCDDRRAAAGLAPEVMVDGHFVDGRLAVSAALDLERDALH